MRPDRISAASAAATFARSPPHRRLRDRLPRLFTPAAFAAGCLGCFLELRGEPWIAPLAFGPRLRHFAGGGGTPRTLRETLLGQAHNYGTTDSQWELGLYGAFYTHTKPPASRAEPNRDRR